MVDYYLLDFHTHLVLPVPMLIMPRMTPIQLWREQVNYQSPQQSFGQVRYLHCKHLQFEQSEAELGPEGSKLCTDSRCRIIEISVKKFCDCEFEEQK